MGAAEETGNEVSIFSYVFSIHILMISVLMKSNTYAPITSLIGMKYTTTYNTISFNRRNIYLIDA